MSHFAPVCGGRHGRRVLLGDRQIDALRPVEGGGVALDFTCPCGWAGTLLPDGRTVARPGPVPARRGAVAAAAQPSPAPDPATPSRAAAPAAVVADLAPAHA